MNADQEEMLEAHEETLNGTKLNPHTGLVPRFDKLEGETRFAVSLSNIAKSWPVRILLGGLTVYATGRVVNFLTATFGGGS